MRCTDYKSALSYPLHPGFLTRTAAKLQTIAEQHSPMSEGQLSTYDKDVLKRIEDIEHLPEEDKAHLFYVIDNLIKAVKLKSIA